MKTRIKVLLVMLSVAFYSTATYATIQNTVNPIAFEYNELAAATIVGVYKGHDDSGYTFTITDEKGEETITTFSSVDEAVAKSNDLDSKAAVGTTFEITFTVAEDGEKVITGLKSQH